MIKRIFSSMFIAIILTFLLSFILIFSVLYDYFTNLGISQLKTEMIYVKDGYLSEGADYFKRIGSDIDRVTLINSDGAAIYDNKADVSIMLNQFEYPEVQGALKIGSGSASRFSNTMLETSVYYAVRLDDGNVLRVSGNRYSPLTLILGMLQPFIVIVVFIISLSAYLSWKVSKRIVRPLNELDLDNPEKNIYENELAPLLRRIRNQKRDIDNSAEELRQSREELNSVTKNMQEGFVLVNNRAEIINFNDSAEKLLGEIKGGSLLTVNRSRVFRDMTDDAIKGQKSERSFELFGKHYQIFCNPIYKDGLVVGATLFIIDVTEKREREDLRREFSANVSHELKTPLTSISGYAEIMMSGHSKPEDNRAFAEKIYDEAWRLIRLIQDIIKLSALDERINLPEKQSVDLYGLSSQILRRLKPEADKNDIAIIISGEAVFINGYERILDEMIYNLSDNAVKYNKPGGIAEINIANDAGKAVVTVKDTGIGISEHDQERVFERFYRVDKARSKETGGTGLGLSIVKHGAMLHGAQVKLTSRTGIGTEVKIVF